MAGFAFRSIRAGNGRAAPDYDSQQYIRWRELRKQHEKNIKKLSRESPALNSAAANWAVSMLDTVTRLAREGTVSP